MDKIKELLQKIGASNEFAIQLCEELERFDRQIQEKYERICEAKLSQAKKICLEEVNGYKVGLAQKVRVFLEGKSNHIEKRLDQQKAIEEGKAKATLRRVKEITEGIEVADDAKLRALQSQIDKLRATNTQLTEDKTRAIMAANRANSIAMEILEKKNVQPVNESAVAASSVQSEKPVQDPKTKIQTESKKVQAKQKVLKESVKKTRMAKPRTTRKVMAETKPLNESKNFGLQVDDDIASIASSIE